MSKKRSHNLTTSMHDDLITIFKILIKPVMISYLFAMCRTPAGIRPSQVIDYADHIFITSFYHLQL